MSGPPPDPRGGCPGLPGSETKVEWMTTRSENGWAIHHPDDRVYEDLQGPMPKAAFSARKDVSESRTASILLDGSLPYHGQMRRGGNRIMMDD